MDAVATALDFELMTGDAELDWEPVAIVSLDTAAESETEETRLDSDLAGCVADERAVDSALEDTWPE